MKEGTWTIYFEEVQWLANYQDSFFSEFKVVWDNHFRHNNNLIVVFCGSSPSFLASQLLSNKAFYNRTTSEIFLKPFNLIETKSFIGYEKSNFEVMIGYLLLGGIPTYLKFLQNDNSVLMNIGKNSFLTNSFFSLEKDKIFVSSLAKDKNFEKIVQLVKNDPILA